MRINHEIAVDVEGKSYLIILKMSDEIEDVGFDTASELQKKRMLDARAYFKIQEEKKCLQFRPSIEAAQDIVMMASAIRHRVSKEVRRILKVNS